MGEQASEKQPSGATPCAPMLLYGSLERCPHSLPDDACSACGVSMCFLESSLLTIGLALSCGQLSRDPMGLEAPVCNRYRTHTAYCIDPRMHGCMRHGRLHITCTHASAHARTPTHSRKRERACCLFSVPPLSLPPCHQVE